MRALKAFAIIALWLPLMVAGACAACFVVSIGVARMLADVFGPT